MHGFKIGRDLDTNNLYPTFSNLELYSNKFEKRFILLTCLI